MNNQICAWCSQSIKYEPDANYHLIPNGIQDYNARSFRLCEKCQREEVCSIIRLDAMAKFGIELYKRNSLWK